MRSISIRLFAALAVALALIAAGPVRADDKKDIMALYPKAIAAMKAKNVKAIMALGTDDFTSKEANGMVMDAKQSAQMMEMQFKMMKTMDVSMKVTKLDIKGKNAVAMTSYSLKGTMTGPDGKDHSVSDTGITKDILVKTGKGWLIKSTETIKSSPMQDGKPIVIPTAPPAGSGKKK